MTLEFHTVKYKNAALIGLGSTTGPGSGKSFTAELVQELIRQYYPEVSVFRLSFAAPLKEMAGTLMKELFGYDPEALKKDEMLPEGFTYRDLLVVLGTKVVRKTLGQDFWLDLLLAGVKGKCLNTHNTHRKMLFIVDDIRFKNELSALGLIGGTIFDVRSSEAHEDCTDLVESDFEAAIRNDGTPSGLRKDVLNSVLPVIISELSL
jgi:hypothetical protein